MGIICHFRVGGLGNSLQKPKSPPRGTGRDCLSLSLLLSVPEDLHAALDDVGQDGFLTPDDAVSGETAKGGWARMMNSGMSKEQIAKLPLEKYLGVRGWSDPSGWM